MGKIRLDALSGLSPRAKSISFEAEKNGIPTTVTLDIYPFTTNEKLQLKQMEKEIKNISNLDERNIRAEQHTYEMVHFILSKSIEGITLEDVKQMIPPTWFESIIKTALSFEGITEEKFEELKKKTQSAQ